jgi:uncharacterized protein YbjT (DUF2867 family)
MRHSLVLIVAAVVASAGLAGCTGSGARPEAGALVLVAGGSGRTGSRIVEQLTTDGYRVRPLTSDIDRAIERHGDRWPWIEADVRVIESLKSTMQGVDFVICAIGARQRSGPDGPEFVDYGGVRNLVDAAQAAGVKQLVLISSSAAGPHRRRSRMTELGDIREWKTRGEEYLKRSGLDYTIIGPGGLEDRPSSGEGVRLLTRADYRGGQIARGDVALVAVTSLGNPAATGKTFAVIRDESLPADAWRTMLGELPLDVDTDEAVTDTELP